MADDGSLATKTENWIVEKLKTIQFGVADAFDSEDVKPWEGSNAETFDQFTTELLSGVRNSIARVYFFREIDSDISSEEIKGAATYVILIGIRNFREAAWRRGDGKMWGANAMKNLIKKEFNQAKPDFGDGNYWCDEAHVRAFEVKLGTNNTCIMQVLIEVDEVPQGA